MLLKKFKVISLLANLEYKAVHRKKYFGIIWKFLNPLIFILIYTFVFSTLNAGGNRGFIISMGVLLFSGISTSLNSSTLWIRDKLLGFTKDTESFIIYFFSKIYFNFIPVLYLLPVVVLIQRLVFNKDFNFTLFESFSIYLQSFLLTIFTMVYVFILSVPISIICKIFTDFEDLISHIVRIATYLSPILWVAKTGNFLIDSILQILNPFYFIFEILNYIIYRNYNFSFITLISPIIIVIFSYIFFFKNSKFIKYIMETLYL